ncbi:MAG: hypothetical protein HKP16_11410 [Xanthomonadales bacterium]|nr:hypothetical protein [Xanthomonadales bacterium]
MDISKGDHVLHPQHGVGEIRSISDRSFSGHPEARYVQLYFKRNELTMTVLEEDLFGLVRSLISTDDARELLSQVNAWDGKPEAQWKARANANQAALDSGDPFEYVKVLKGLAHLETGGALRSGDRQHLSQSLGLLTEELACALKKTPGEVRKLLSKAIGAPLQAF